MNAESNTESHVEPTVVLADSQRAAPAKINIFLEVLGRRDDGFHELETVFQTLSLADVVRVQCLQGPLRTSVVYTNADHDFGTKDLAFRAAEAYRFYCPCLQSQEIIISIEKNIPISAGLGGGSSDAAAVLRALMEYSPIDEALVHKIALSLGSDVPFFLIGGTAYATGRGESCVALDDFINIPMYLITPEKGNGTASVFAALEDDERGPREAVGAGRWQHMQSAWNRRLSNRLSRAARTQNSTLDQLCAELDAQGAQWLLCGSGSSCFVCAATPPQISADLTCTLRKIQFRTRADLNSRLFG